jgi:DNA-binding transcriptional LysR family regulator
MLIDPRNLEMLNAIVESGGLTEAAERLGKSQPSVSRSLALLEQRVGTPLFEKGKRPLRPTELCLALAQEGKTVRAATHVASRIIDNYAKGERGLLRIAGSPIFMDGVVVPLLAKFQVQNPHIEIEQSYAYAEETMRHLETGVIDLAVQPLNPDAISEKFEFSELIQGRNVIACGSLHPLAKKKTIKLMDIRDYPWVAPPIESPLYHDLRTTLVSIGVQDFKVSFSGGSLTSIITILAQTDALTILPYSVVFLTQKQLPVHPLAIRIQHPERSLGTLQHRATLARPSTIRFKKFIEKEFRVLKSTIQSRGTASTWR